MSVAAVPRAGVGLSEGLTTRVARPAWERVATFSTAAAVASFPLLQPSGPGNTSLPDAFVALSVLSVLAWGYSSRQVMRMPFLIPISVMIVAGAVAALLGNYPGEGLLTLAQDAFVLAWCAAIVAVCRTPHGMSIVVRTWAYSAVVWALILVVTVLGQIDFIAGITARTGSRAALTFGDPNLAAGYFDAAIMMVWATQTPRRRGWRWLAYLALVTAVVMTGSNGFSLGLIAATGVAGTIGLCRRRGAVTGLAVSCTVLLLAGTVASQVNFNSLVQAAAASSPILSDYVGREQQSADGRDALLQEVMNLAVQGGVIGIGAAAVKPTLIDQHAPIEFEAHSDYTAALAERGLLGVLGLLTLIVAIAWYARGALKPMRPDYAAVIKRPGALVGCVVTFAVGAGIYEVIHFRHLWALFGIIAALHFARRGATA